MSFCFCYNYVDYARVLGLYWTFCDIMFVGIYVFSGLNCFEQNLSIGK